MLVENPLSIIGQLPVAELEHPVVLNREGENSGLHDLKDLLSLMMMTKAKREIQV